MAVDVELFGKILPMERGAANDRRIARIHAAAAVGVGLLLKAGSCPYCTGAHRVVRHMVYRCSPPHGVLVLATSSTT